MDALTALFAAYSIIFLIIFVYAYSIGSRQRSLAREIRALRDLVEDEKGAPSGSQIESRPSSMAEIEG
jgi:CcmD family protein